MAITNGYCTLAEVKALLDITSTNSTDDGVIEALVEASSRYIDAVTGHTYYARTETHYYDTPVDRELFLADDDLLTVTSITNGDGTAVASSEYNLLPRNDSPKFAVKLKSTSTTQWTSDSAGETESAITIVGTWGYASTTPANIKLACELITVTAYRNRYGNGAQGAATVTGAGVVITPSDIPASARELIKTYAGRI